MSYKYNPLTGKPDYYESSSSGNIGTPSDGSWEDGAANISPNDSHPDALDKLNETLAYLLPDPPSPLNDITFSTTFYSGYVANHSSLNTFSAGEYINTIVTTANIHFSTSEPNIRFSNADKGILEVYTNGTSIDSFDLASHFNESEKNGNQSYPPASSSGNRITITSVGWFNNFPAYQKGNASFSLTSGDINVGENSIRVNHSYDSTNDSSPTYNLFFDDSGRPSIDGFMATLNSESTIFMSGIEYYDINTSWGIDISVVGVFDKTYVSLPVRFYSSVHNNMNIAWNDTHSSGYSTPPDYNDAWNYTNNLQCNRIGAGDSITFTSQARDPIGWGVSSSITRSYCLWNTYNSISTDTHEYFVDETYRLPYGDYSSIPSSIIGQWDSSQVLVNGNAQVYVNRLVYPSIDFTNGWEPSPQQAGTNYSTFTGDQLYFRAFRDSGNPHNSGQLRIKGILWSDLGSNLNIHLKLPSQTGWLDLSKDYNAAIFTGADDDGAMTGHSQSGDVLTINWTSGTFSTASSGNMYILRITLINSTKNITEIWDFE